MENANESILDRIQIKNMGITKIPADCIVNTVGPRFTGKNPVSRAIFETGGPELEDACKKIGSCSVGEAVITDAYNINNVKHVIHTVSPHYWAVKLDKEKDPNAPFLLKDCYWNSLELAKEKSCHTIVFPLISAGANGFPVDEAWEIALCVCKMFLNSNADMTIIFAIPDSDVVKLGERYLYENEIKLADEAERERIINHYLDGMQLPSEVKKERCRKILDYLSAEKSNKRSFYEQTTPLLLKVLKLYHLKDLEMILMVGEKNYAQLFLGLLSPALQAAGSQMSNRSFYNGVSLLKEYGKNLNSDDLRKVLMNNQKPDTYGSSLLDMVVMETLIEQTTYTKEERRGKVPEMFKFRFADIPMIGKEVKKVITKETYGLQEMLIIKDDYLLFKEGKRQKLLIRFFPEDNAIRFEYERDQSSENKKVGYIPFNMSEYNYYYLRDNQFAQLKESWTTFGVIRLVSKGMDKWSDDLLNRLDRKHTDIIAKEKWAKQKKEIRSQQDNQKQEQSLKIAELESEREKLAQKVRDIEEKLMITSQELEKSRNNESIYQKNVSEWQFRRAEYENELSELKAKIAAEETDYRNIRDELEAAREREVYLDLEIRKLKEEIENLQQERDILSSEIQKVKYASGNADVQMSEKYEDKLFELRAKIAEEKDGHRKTRDELEAARERGEYLNLEIRKLQKERENHQQKIENLQEEIKTLQHEKDIVSSEIQKVEEAAKNANAQMSEKYEDELSELKARIAIEEAVHQNIRDELETAREKEVRLELEIKELKEERENLQQEKDKLSSEINKVKDASRNADEQMKRADIFMDNLTRLVNEYQGKTADAPLEIKTGGKRNRTEVSAQRHSTDLTKTELPPASPVKNRTYAKDEFRLEFFYGEKIHDLKEPRSINFSDEFQIHVTPEQIQIAKSDSEENIPEHFFGEKIRSIHAVIGKNGSGKSSLFDLICNCSIFGATGYREDDGKYFLIYSVGSDTFYVNSTGKKVIDQSGRNLRENNTIPEVLICKISNVFEIGRDPSKYPISQMIDMSTQFLMTKEDRAKDYDRLRIENYQKLIQADCLDNLDPFDNKVVSDLSHLSSGERARLTIFARLLSIFCVHDDCRAIGEPLEKENYILMFDEAELYFHPSWQRNLIRDLCRFIAFIDQNLTAGSFIHNVTILLSSNSPFYMSDLPTFMVHKVLTDQQSRELIEEKADSFGNDTFGQNIYSLLKDSFFLNEGVIGAFAQEKIEHALALLSDYEKYGSLLIKKTEDDKILPEEAREICYIHSVLGDPLMKKILGNMIGKKGVSYVSD